MNAATLMVIATTVMIHLIGISLFLVWMVAGRPMSVDQLRDWWKSVELIPAPFRYRKRGVQKECC